MPTWEPLKAKRTSRRRLLRRRARWKNKETFGKRAEAEPAAARGISRLVAWCKKQGYEVVFRKNCRDEVFYELKRITIRNRFSLQSQLIALLHEIGHICLHDKDPAEYMRRFGYGWAWDIKKNRKLKSRHIHRMQILEEEIAAWDVGWRLASELKLQVDLHLWNQIKYVCLASYAGWSKRRSTLAP